MDTSNLADYMVLSFYLGNDWDWWTQRNWSAAGPRLPDQGGWQNGKQDAPDGVFSALMEHADFKVLFRDGVLTPAKAAASYDLRANSIATAIVAETARWQPSSSVGPLPWDRDGTWPQGPVECGYGDDDEVTNVGYAGSSSSKNITTYFRHNFNVANPAAISGLTFGSNAPTARATC